ncbi:MAG: hypothetical protein ACRC1J_03710, partial [Sandaracinobacteroides sp.]
HLFLWRALIDRYQVADVLIPELILDRQWAGGPVSGLLIVRFGTTGREIGRVRLVNRGGDVDGLADTAVREADKLYVAALRAGNLLPDPNLIEPDVPVTDLEDTGPAFAQGGDFGGGRSFRVATPDDATLRAIQTAIGSVPGVSGVRLQSLVLGGESVLEIVSSLSAEEFRYALDARGLRLEGTIIRRKLAGEALLAPPAPQAGEEQLEEAPVPGPSGGVPKALLPGGAQ